jgi:hypothetical protein
MRKHILVIFALVAFLTPAVFLRAQQAAPVRPGSLRGVVVREGTSDPIRDVQITLGQRTPIARGLQAALDRATAGTSSVLIEAMLGGIAAAQNLAGPSGQPSYSAVTDANGRFTIEGIAPGDYPMVAQREGYFASSLVSPPPALVHANTTIRSEQTSEVRLTMIPGAAVSGRVVGPDGAPLVGASVEVLRRAYENGVLTLKVANQNQSDDRGAFRLHQLAPDEYFVAVHPRRAGGLLPMRTYYPSAIDLASAIPITLKSGDDIPALTIQVRTAAGAKISGRVVSLLPAPGAIPDIAANFIATGGTSASLMLLPRDRATPVDNTLNGVQRVSMLTPNNGSFEISNVPPGQYDLYASLPDPKGYGPAAPPGQAQQPLAYGRVSFVVSGSDISGVTVEVRSGVDVPGKVVVDGKPTSAGMRLSLQAIDSAANLQVFNQVGQFQPQIAADGSFVIPAVPEAIYRLQAGTLTTADEVNEVFAQDRRARRGRGAITGNAAPLPPPLPRDAYIADVRHGGVSVYDDGVHIGTGTIGPLEVLVRTNGGAVSGTLVGTNQQPVGATAVVLIPPANRRGNLALYKTALTNTQGVFTIRGVAPGQYKLFAWDNISALAHENPDFVKRYENRGVTVTAEAGVTVYQTVRLISR